jgi:two-component system cell cycle sensor histidine kinase PleC
MTNAASQKGLAEEQALRDRLVMLLLWSLIGVVVLLGGGAVALARGISGPLLRLSATMRKLAEGDLTVEVPETDRGDEIGMMARTVKVFRRNAKRIAALQKETEAAKLRAEEAVQSKSLFIANTSHELRTPLNAIIGFSDFLAQGLAGPLGAKQADYVTDIHGAGQHLLSVINDILDLSKAEAGRMTLAEDTIDVADLARGCLRLVEPRARESGVVLVADIAPDLPPLRADALRLRQILLNLVSNAVKFTSAGGSVTIQASRAANGELGISVTDTGVGMDADQIETALEMYGQVTSPLTGVQEGTGLGLPLSKKLVELLGGTFALASAPGKGTVVLLTFPAERLGKPPVSR